MVNVVQEESVAAAVGSPTKKPCLDKNNTVPQLTLQVKKLVPEAQLPKRGSEFAAGYDLTSVQDCSIPAGSKLLIKTGLSIAIPAGHYGRIAPRSGLAAKHFIDVGAGVIDADYRGEVQVLLFNLNREEGGAFEVKKGDRIAQLVLEKISTPEVEEVEELGATVRGAGGFGSTGK
jgi:dUTP pyrophosphatase